MSAIKLTLWTVALQSVLLTQVALGDQTAAAFKSAKRFDAVGQLTGEILPDPDGAGPLGYPATRYTYDSAGRKVAVEQGELSAWQDESIAPAAWGAVFQVAVARHSTYDEFGRVLRDSTYAEGQAQTLVQNSYDNDGRLECKATRMNPANFATAPASACMKGGSGAFGEDRIEHYSYDAAGQLLQIQKAYNTPLQQAYATYTYKVSGKTESVTDANGNRAEYGYDGHGRQTHWYFPSKTNPGSTNYSDYEGYSYDANGNRTLLRKRDGVQVIGYQYDNLNRVVVKDLPGSASDVYYGYDLRGLQTFARFASASGQGITEVYDGLGRRTSSTSNMGGVTRTLGYQHDLNGNRTRITHPDSSYFTYAYDGLDRNSAIQLPDQSVLVALSYNERGRRKGLQRLNSTDTQFDYDGISRLSDLTHNLVGTGDDVDYGFDYNPASQIVSRSLTNSSYEFTHSAASSKSYTPDGLNQYAVVAGVSYSYDLNGNLTSDGATSYTYDTENRLLSAVGQTNASLRYDPLGRLYEVSSGSGTTRFVYDGDALVAEYDGSGTLVRRYVHGPGVDEPLVWFEGASIAASAARYLHADHQGSVNGITDSTGAVLAINVYDSYGVGDAANLGRFGYTGQAWLPELGLYHYKARIYSPGLGRFLQTDPIGYEDNVNLYAYVGNDPVNRADPKGLYGRGTGWTDKQWDKFNTVQQKAADRMEAAASLMETDASQLDAEGVDGGDALREKAGYLKAGASALRSDGADGKIANAVSASTYKQMGGSADGAAFVRGNGPIMTVNMGNKEAWGPGSKKSGPSVGHESLHTAGLNDQKGPNGSLAYKYGNKSQKKAFNEIKGTVYERVNPDHLMDEVF